MPPLDPADISASGKGGSASLNLLQLEQLKQDILSGLPYVAFEYVDVIFGGADTDLDIRHGLRPANPENIHYEVIKTDRSTVIYNDQSGTRRPWGAGYVILRSSAASAVVTLRLFIPRR